MNGVCESAAMLTCLLMGFIGGLLLLAIKVQGIVEDEPKKPKSDGLTRFELRCTTAQAMAYDKRRRKARKGGRYGRVTIR